MGQCDHQSMAIDTPSILGVSKMTNSPEQLVLPLVEPLVTIKAAAERLGLPEYKLQRAARAGLIPTYSIFNGRRLVRLSEVVAVIETTRQGGQT
jgi:helix-turn-helix protein